MTQTDTLHSASQSANQHMSSFLLWYFGERPREIVQLYVRYAQAFGEAFSFMFLLKTLIAPWKRITDEYPQKGFNIEMILQTLSLNLTSRAIGLVFRIFAMITGVIIEATLLVGFAVYLLIWILFPLLVIVSVPYIATLPF